MVSRIPRARSEINPPKLRNSILMSKLLHGLLHLASGTKIFFDIYPLHINREIRKDWRYTMMKEWRIHIICVGGPKLSCFSTKLLRDLFGYFDARVDVLSLLCSGHTPDMNFRGSYLTFTVSSSFSFSAFLFYPPSACLVSNDASCICELSFKQLCVRVCAYVCVCMILVVSVVSLHRTAFMIMYRFAIQRIFWI